MKSFTKLFFTFFPPFIFFVNDLSGQVFSPIKLNVRKSVNALGQNDENSPVKPKLSWILAKNAEEAATIWSNGNRWTFLNTASLSGSKNSSSAAVEIVSDYLGPIRFGLIGNVSSANKDSTNKSSIDRFFTSGGSAALSANFFGPTFSWGNYGYILLNVNPKLGFDFPALGSSTSSSTTNLDLGIELKANLPLKNNKMGFFGILRQSFVMGGKSFYQQLNLDNKSPFFYSTANIGITLPDLNLAILFSKALTGPNIIDTYNETGRISIVLAPQRN